MKNTIRFRNFFILVMICLVTISCTLGKPMAEIEEMVVMVPMRDGVALQTWVYLPPGEAPWPVVFSRTPYGAVGQKDFAHNLALSGIAVVVQDVRGQNGSEGTFSAFFDDRQDGQDTLDWIASQYWFDGHLLTQGGSALGMAQYLLAPDAPDALSCQFISVATPQVYEAVFRDGVYRYELAQYWLEGNHGAHLIDLFRENPANDAFWSPARINDYAQVHVPAFHIAGWYDIYAREQIEGFLGYQQEGGSGAAGQQHLVMGPWTHDVGNPQVGEIIFPEQASLPEMGEWQEMFYRACLFEGQAAADYLTALAPVHFYTMGADEDQAPGNLWQQAESWPPAGYAQTLLYFSADGGLSETQPENPHTDIAFISDPADPVPTLGGGNLNIPAGAVDQAELVGREDTLFFETVVLDRSFEVTGDLTAVVWVQSNAPDLDLAVRLVDVYPDGRMMLIADSITRARYAGSNDFIQENFMMPDTPVKLTIDLGPTSLVIPEGHRLGVIVSGSNSPRFAVNPQDGRLYGDEDNPGLPAEIVMLTGSSYLEIPVRVWE